MKIIFTMLTLLSGINLFAANNLPDMRDENLVPAEKEERLFEDVNRSDIQDANLVPAEEEERQETEYPDSGSDIIDRDAVDDEVRD